MMMSTTTAGDAEELSDTTLQQVISTFPETRKSRLPSLNTILESVKSRATTAECRIEDCEIAYKRLTGVDGRCAHMEHMENLLGQLDQKIDFYSNMYKAYITDLKQVMDFSEENDVNTDRVEKAEKAAHAQFDDLDTQIAFAVFKRTQDFINTCCDEICEQCDPLKMALKEPELRKLIFDYMFK